LLVLSALLAPPSARAPPFLFVSSPIGDRLVSPCFIRTQGCSISLFDSRVCPVADGFPLLLSLPLPRLKESNREPCFFSSHGDSEAPFAHRGPPFLQSQFPRKPSALFRQSSGSGKDPYNHLLESSLPRRPSKTFHSEEDASASFRHSFRIASPFL